MLTRQQLIDAVCATYEREQSLKKTAQAMGISLTKVRKILIDQNAYVSELSERIRELRDVGLDEATIAKELGLSRSIISSNSPYVRPVYGVDGASTNATRIREWREIKDEPHPDRRIKSGKYIGLRNRAKNKED